MTPRYFIFALLITVVATLLSWTSMLSDGSGGRSWRSGSGHYSGWGGSGHK